eukprot:TRINITY_DN73327_c0_g1_i1.p1 TRINITY_DN73327_c0_g1~~TRINITY_DN73327_c0_g1_i1.p1  ORF type:complete len:521 (+),score=139.39 TRINITY_DN73327_c0_g1_i1:83-1564(+)
MEAFLAQRLPWGAPLGRPAVGDPQTGEPAWQRPSLRCLPPQLCWRTSLAVSSACTVFGIALANKKQKRLHWQQRGGEACGKVRVQLSAVSTAQPTAASIADAISGKKQADDKMDVSFIQRSGTICVLGVPNSGKSSLVNALVGRQVSIVSPKPQTTRQKVLGLALLAPKPGEPVTTQACFVDTAGIMALSRKQQEQPGIKRVRKRSFSSRSILHKAMVKTAWKSTRQVDAVFWVVDAYKCWKFGDFMASCAELDGVVLGPSVREPWWTHPELEEELAFLRRIKKMKKKVYVVLNKVDLLREEGGNVEEAVATIEQQLRADLGTEQSGGEGDDLLQAVWGTSILREPDSLTPIREWLCENLPRRDTLYPVAAVSDVPARVMASEITREALFHVLPEEVPYALAVMNVIWKEMPDGRLLLGQTLTVQTDDQARTTKKFMTGLRKEVEEEISERLNDNRPVELRFKLEVDAKWQEKPKYYTDVAGLLLEDSLMFPS